MAPASFNAADTRPLPPVGAPPSAGTPAIAPAAAPPVNPSQPVVEAYDEVTYRTKAGDTFESIAKEKYESEKYGKALVLFNRNHFRPAEGIGQEPPRLQAGQPVYIPPVYILERHYATAIPGFDPAAAAPSAATLTPPAAALSQKAPAGETQPAKAYRVRPGGEMFRDIAKRTLGDPDRWWDIGQLNPQYNPAFPLKPGTVLHMPANAQVEAADAPQS